MDLSIKGSKKKLAVSDQTFDRPYSEALVHQVVTAYMAGGRAGTKAQKSRSDARGGGRKPWRQKGTGRARSGTIRSPIWRGGGRTFAARPRDYSQKVNRKMYRGAMQAIISELFRQERVTLVSKFEVKDHKTSAAIAKLEKLGLTQGLILVGEVTENLWLSTRNIPGVYVCDVHGVDPVSLMGAKKIIMTVEWAEKAQEWLG